MRKWMNWKAPAAPGLQGLGVERWTRLSRSFTASAGLVIVALAFVPLFGSANVTQKLTGLFILVMLSTMWNALAGYGGLVSVGQQTYIGVGAYSTILLARAGVSPYPAMLIAIVVSGIAALALSFLVLRLRGGQFSIATWVVAAAFAIIISLDKALGGGTGISLIELNRYTPAQRQSYTYWFVLGVMTLFIGLLFVLLRSQVGATLQAIRDDEHAASSVGVRVMARKRLLYVFSGLGFGAVGAAVLANTLFIQPQATFGVSWMAYAIFMVIVGGLGTFEGPIIGAILLFVIQDRFADYGVWYLVALGVAAILFALLLPRGIWGTIEGRFGVQLLPVGYRVRGIKEWGKSVLSGTVSADPQPEDSPPSGKDGDA